MSILWKIGGGLVALAAVYLLVSMYGRARFHEGQAEEARAWSAKVEEADRGRLAAFQQGLAHQQAAETVYRETVRTLPPVTQTIIERSAAYAQTPSGSATCLEPDRVRALDATRSALFPAAPAPAAAR